MEAIAMPYELTVEKRPDYLYAHVEGEVPEAQAAVEYLEKITDECRKEQCTKVIIEKDGSREFGVWDVFFVATRFPKLGVELTKIAVVDKARTPQRKEFSVVVGHKAGVNVHMFKSIREAEWWVMN